MTRIIFYLKLLLFSCLFYPNQSLAQRDHLPLAKQLIEGFQERVNAIAGSDYAMFEGQEKYLKDSIVSLNCEIYDPNLTDKPVPVSYYLLRVRLNKNFRLNLIPYLPISNLSPEVIKIKTDKYHFQINLQSKRIVKVLPPNYKLKMRIIIIDGDRIIMNGRQFYSKEYMQRYAEQYAKRYVDSLNRINKALKNEKEWNAVLEKQLEKVQIQRDSALKAIKALQERNYAKEKYRINSLVDSLKKVLDTFKALKPTKSTRERRIPPKIRRRNRKDNIVIYKYNEEVYTAKLMALLDPDTKIKTSEFDSISHETITVKINESPVADFFQIVQDRPAKPHLEIRYYEIIRIIKLNNGKSLKQNLGMKVNTLPAVLDKQGKEIKGFTQHFKIGKLELLLKKNKR